MNSLFAYTLRSLARFGFKSFSIALIFSFLVFFLSSVILINESLKKELLTVAKSTPQILINRQVGGRYMFLKSKDLEPFWEIPGVSYVKGRVWGHYFFPMKNLYLTLVGVAPYEEHFHKSITKIAQQISLDENETPFVYYSKSVHEALKNIRLSSNIINLEKVGGGFEKLKVKGFFKSETQLLSNDVLLMSNDSVRRVLGMQKDFFTDAVLSVPNKDEVSFIVAKIAHEYPQLTVTTQDEIVKEYELLYQFKSGWFLMLLSVAFVVFAIILYDKATGLRSEERREIGLLKALGWEIEHILHVKLLESVVLSCGAFLLGIVVALFYVYFLDAFGLKYIFTGYSELRQPFELDFAFDVKTFAMLFFATVPLYIGFSIIPSWKAATKDAGDMLR